MTSRAEIPVLIVGAGPVGLMGALLFARHGVEARIVDRREAPLRAPAAHVVNARTFEICRAAGVDMEALAAQAADPRDAGHALWVPCLAGEEIARLPFERQGDEVLRFTPTPLRNMAQHRFENILRDSLAKRGAPQVEYGHRWESAVQDATGVTSRVRDLRTGRVEEIRSRFLVACDGAGSAVRKAVGIAMDGPPHLQRFVMIHFSANLRDLVRGREGVLYWLTDPELGVAFIAHDIEREWVYMVPLSDARESADDYPPERCRALVRAGIGSDAPRIEIETVATWAMSAQVAERFGEGRVFLAGDAAHRFPPTGGLGMNSGIQDIHGLAWRIAAVEAGWAQPALLDSYTLERRRVARTNADNSLRNATRLFEVARALGFDEERTRAQMQRTLADPAGRARVERAIADQAEHFDTLGLQLGYRYDEGAIVPDGTPAPQVANPVREIAPTGRPGARLPHAWLVREGRRCSTLDLLAPGAFSLVTMDGSGRWAAAASAVRGAPVHTISLEAAAFEDAPRWLAESGIGERGALLVRPDQHVAWRTAALPDDPERALDEAIARITRGEIHRASPDPSAPTAEP